MGYILTDEGRPTTPADSLAGRANRAWGGWSKKIRHSGKSQILAT
ncbi:hypothetical protein [Spirosoma areae]